MNTGHRRDERLVTDEMGGTFALVHICRGTTAAVGWS